MRSRARSVIRVAAPSAALLLGAFFVSACGGSSPGNNGDANPGDATLDTRADGSPGADGSGDTDAGTDAATALDARGDVGPGTDSGADATPSDGAVASDATCPAGQTDCAGTCVVTAVDRNNCGGCGVACNPGEACVSHGCTATCPDPLTLCTDHCADTTTANTDCGACGNACPAGQGCSNGACVDIVPVGPGPARCAAGGPPIVIDGGGETACSGDLAMVAFTHALCSCGDILLSSPANFDAFDSSRGPYVPGQAGGSVGTNGTITSSSTFNATGDVRVTGATGLRANSGHFTIGESLRVATNLAGNGNLAVDRDGFVGGTFANDRGATFGRTLHTPDCSAVPATYTSASCQSEAVTVPQPCACDPSDLIPVRSIVRAYADPARNDDASLSLASNVLSVSAGHPVRLDLPCGYYYFDSIQAANPVTIAVHGNTALFIGGDITISSALAFTVDPGFTLDVFVLGTLRNSGQLRIGSPASPTSTRFYIGGPCLPGGARCDVGSDCCSGSCTSGVCTSATPTRLPAVALSVPADMNGLFYAPNGPLLSSGPLQMYGAIFTGSYTASQLTTIHYDLATYTAGGTCEMPGGGGDAGVASDAASGSDGAGADGGGAGGCGSCRDCHNQACINGECGACRTDSDCCSPLYCIDGQCVYFAG